MSHSRKISYKKLFRFLAGIVIVIGFLVTVVVASEHQNIQTIKGLDIYLNDDKDFNFLNKKDIEDLIKKNNTSTIENMSLKSVDLNAMERIVQTNPWVKKADIFIDNRNILQVDVTQRRPIARIFSTNGSNFYLDHELNKMPPQVGITHPVPVFTNVQGHISDSSAFKLYHQIKELSVFIENDSFWKSQITQVEVQSDQSFVLIPLLGNQKILFGKANHIENKFERLLLFYSNVSNKIGWDKYELLDVRFEKQIVAFPALGWIPPKIVDTVSFNIDLPVKKDSTIIAVDSKTVKSDGGNLVEAASSTNKNENKIKEQPKKIIEEKQEANSKIKNIEKPKSKQDNKQPKYIYPGNSSGNN